MRGAHEEDPSELKHHSIPQADAIADRFPVMKGIIEQYMELAASEFRQGRFQTVIAAWHNDGKDVVLARLRVVSGHEHDEWYHAHPATVDGAFQLVGMLRSWQHHQAGNCRDATTKLASARKSPNGPKCIKMDWDAPRWTQKIRNGKKKTHIDRNGKK